MRRWLLTLLAWLLATAVITPLMAFAVLVLAGPHSDMLPKLARGAVLLLGWLVVLGGPALIARAAWRRLS